MHIAILFCWQLALTPTLSRRAREQEKNAICGDLSSYGNTRQIVLWRTAHLRKQLLIQEQQSEHALQDLTKLSEELGLAF